MLVVPDFEPPPPTPSPLFYFPLPVKPAVKPVWNPPQERKRRLKVWDMMPDLPRAVEPQQQLTEPVHTQRLQCSGAMTSSANAHVPKVAPPPANPDSYKGLPRRSAQGNLGALANKPSPTAVEIIQHIIGYELRSQSESMRRGQNQARRSREGFHCGVDLSALWSVVVDFVFSPVEERPLVHCSVQQPYCREAEECSRADPVPSDAHEVDFVSQDGKAFMSQGKGFLLEQAKGPMYTLRHQDGGKGARGSPMSILSPLSTEKSSAESSPYAHSLLAFVERDASPLKL